MPILRYIPGKFDEKRHLNQKISYLDDARKQIWNGEQLPRGILIGAHGVDFDTAKTNFWTSHALYDFKGKKLFYHLLLDFDQGLLNPFQVREIGLEICDYLVKKDAVFVWGIHCVPRPHMHVVINSRLPLNEGKLQIRKGDIVMHKIWANKVLSKYGLPPIIMTKRDDWSDESHGE